MWMLERRQESEPGTPETPEGREPDAPIRRQPSTRPARLEHAHADRSFYGDAEDAVKVEGPLRCPLDAPPTQHPSADDRNGVVGRLLGPERQGARH